MMAKTPRELNHDLSVTFARFCEDIGEWIRSMQVSPLLIIIGVVVALALFAGFLRNLWDQGDPTWF
jgi:hypothetical protein